jgi:hypothetical protein
VLLGVVLLLYAVARPVLQVKDARGQTCGSAWRSAHRQVVHGGMRTARDLEADTRACERAGDRTLRHALYAGSAGLVMLVGVAVWPVRTPRPPLADPLGRSR